METKIDKLLVLLVAFAASTALAGSVPVDIVADVRAAQTHNVAAWRGETLALSVHFTDKGVAMPLQPADAATLYWQTNGMDSAWWSKPATVASNVVTATWTPDDDVGAAAYRVFFGVGGDGTNYRANMILRLQGSPGAAPNHLAPPVQVIDFGEVAWTNAPWALPYQAGENIVITNGVISSTASGGGGGAVDSVNGRTGAVVLGASDVGAVPDGEYWQSVTNWLDGDTYSELGTDFVWGAREVVDFLAMWYLDYIYDDLGYPSAYDGVRELWEWYAGVGYDSDYAASNVVDSIVDAAPTWTALTNWWSVSISDPPSREYDSAKTAIRNLYDVMYNDLSDGGGRASGFEALNALWYWYNYAYDGGEYRGDDYTGRGIVSNGYAAATSATNWIATVGENTRDAVANLGSAAYRDAGEFATAADEQFIYQLVMGSNVVAEVTNYNSSVHAPALRLLQLDPDTREYFAVWTETNGLARTLAEANGHADAGLAALAAAKADCAWSRHTSGLGADAPEGVTWISTPETVVAGGYEYAKTVTSRGEAWVLSSNGLAIGADTNSYFAISDGAGETIFSIERTDSVLVGVDADAIHVIGDEVQIPLAVVSDEPPHCYATTNLVGGTWVDLGDSIPAWIEAAEATGSSGAWTWRITTQSPRAFFQFRAMQEGRTVIRNNTVTELTQGIEVNGRIFRPVVSGGTLTWEAAQ